MSFQAANGRFIVWVTLFIGVISQIMPLPSAVDTWRPDWLLMIVLYWSIALPHRYNILTAWMLGLVLDILLGATLGVRSLAMSLVIYVAILHCQRLRNFPKWQQSLVIMLLICMYHLVIYWVEFVMQEAVFDTDLFLPAISGLVIWPWIFWILRRVRRHYKVR
ncbi:rod shape-determining protein MreD [Shewanella hafniensis]|uniref:rod shape-determining protein MreD n=1 Tax=Shewanella hafniensis TaxID=365590 RepID=UPI001BBB517C|nr:rod shape-determining protein MreD [Shewanella hafniensis]MCL1135090.1 rod shape-determining protein MreD [Shewanella hafniensis]GIU25844.1 rod shape-determining protein MreD [Shewanella hafniensis]